MLQNNGQYWPLAGPLCFVPSCHWYIITPNLYFQKEKSLLFPHILLVFFPSQVYFAFKSFLELLIICSSFVIGWHSISSTKTWPLILWSIECVCFYKENLYSITGSVILCIEWISFFVGVRLCPNGREWLERRTVIHLYEDITAAPAFIVCQIMSNHLESNT